MVLSYRRGVCLLRGREVCLQRGRGLPVEMERICPQGRGICLQRREICLQRRDICLQRSVCLQGDRWLDRPP